MKEKAKVRYVYGMSAAMLIGGAAATLAFGPVGAQTAQNEPGAINAAAPRAGAPMSFADLTARLTPAVVNISTKQSVEVRRNRGMEEFFRQFGLPVPEGQGGGDTVTRRGGSLGSGFIISADGYVVTNNHVIAPAAQGANVDSITVTLADRKEYQARVIGRDTSSDLAVLKIEAQNLPFVRFGDSTRTRVGDWVVAIGNPFGLGGTVTAGIVSALHRNIGATAYDRYIQTDASINSGNSGGPMFDMNGNVVGINNAIFSPTGGSVGIGFAIPAEQARPVVDALMRGRRVERGYIGIERQPVTEDIAAGLGLPKDQGEVIVNVTPGGAAQRAGIRQGDVIVSVAGRPVNPDQNLAFLIAQQPIGSRVPMEVIRDGRRQTVTVQVAQRPSDEELQRLAGVEDEEEVRETPQDQQSTGQRSAQASLGLNVQSLTPQIARSLRLSNPNQRALVIAGIDPNSDAAQKGLQVGDLILSINQRAVATPEEAAAAVDAGRARGTALLLVRRGNGAQRYIGVDLARR